MCIFFQNVTSQAISGTGALRVGANFFVCINIKQVFIIFSVFKGEELFNDIYSKHVTISE